MQTKNMNGATIVSTFESSYNKYIDQFGEFGVFMKPQLIELDVMKKDEIRELGIDPDDITYVKCYAIRLSASGYMDCTDWTLIENVKDIDMWFDMWLD